VDQFPALIAKARRAFDVVRCSAKALVRDQTAMLRRGVAIHCSGCQAQTMTTQTTRLSRRGVWNGDPVAPADWGIRYRRRANQDAVATYYCGACSSKVADGTMKV
jgi:hypothetical protein